MPAIPGGNLGGYPTPASLAGESRHRASSGMDHRRLRRGTQARHDRPLNDDAPTMVNRGEAAAESTRARRASPGQSWPGDVRSVGGEAGLIRGLLDVGPAQAQRRGAHRRTGYPVPLREPLHGPFAVAIEPCAVPARPASSASAIVRPVRRTAHVGPGPAPGRLVDRRCRDMEPLRESLEGPPAVAIEPAQLPDVSLRQLRHVVLPCTPRERGPWTRYELPRAYGARSDADRSGPSAAASWNAGTSSPAVERRHPAHGQTGRRPHPGAATRGDGDVRGGIYPGSSSESRAVGACPAPGTGESLGARAGDVVAGRSPRHG